MVVDAPGGASASQLVVYREAPGSNGAEAVEVRGENPAELTV